MTELTALTAQVAASYVSANRVAPTDVAELVTSVHRALAALQAPVEPEPAPSEVKTRAEIRKSITPEALISFLDGRPYRALKRHLTSKGMTFAAYRERFGLPADYPSTAPDYSAKRSQLAKTMGLGQGRAKASLDALQGQRSSPPPPDTDLPAPKPKQTRKAKAP